jgi:hypothetical protein
MKDTRDAAWPAGSKVGQHWFLALMGCLAVLTLGAMWLFH